MTESSEGSKLHIDSDWKAEAQKEKERLSEKEKSRQQAHAQEGEVPEASFRAIVGMLAERAIMGLGMLADRESGRVVLDLVSSQYFIDVLGILEEKTRGNLTEEESEELKQLLTELRARYVQMSKLAAEQGASTISPEKVSDVKTADASLRTPEG